MNWLRAYIAARRRRQLARLLSIARARAFYSARLERDTLREAELRDKARSRFDKGYA